MDIGSLQANFEQLAANQLREAARFIGQHLAERPQARLDLLLMVRRIPLNEPRTLLVRHFSNPLARQFPMQVWAPDADGHELYLDTVDLIQRTILVSGQWEPTVTSLVRGLLRAGDSFVDVGANVGYYSLLASSLVGQDGYLRAFEASFDLSMRLRANFKRNGLPEAMAVRVAVIDGTDRVGVLEGPRRNRGVSRVTTGIDAMNAGEGATASQGSQASHAAPAGSAGRLPSTVEARPLDALVADLPRERPLVVKIDIEGAEEAASAGLERLLAEGPADVAVLVECTPPAYYRDAPLDTGRQRQGDQHWLFALAERQGLDVFRVDNGYRLEDVFPMRLGKVERVTAIGSGQGDYLAVRGPILTARLDSWRSSS